MFEGSGLVFMAWRRLGSPAPEAAGAVGSLPTMISIIHVHHVQHVGPVWNAEGSPRGLAIISHSGKTVVEFDNVDKQMLFGPVLPEGLNKLLNIFHDSAAPQPRSSLRD